MKLTRIYCVKSILYTVKVPLRMFFSIYQIEACLFRAIFVLVLYNYTFKEHIVYLYTVCYSLLKYCLTRTFVHLNVLMIIIAFRCTLSLDDNVTFKSIVVSGSRKK